MMYTKAQERLLNRHCLEGAEQKQYEAVANSPVTVLQVGEGKFLLGFFDWMIHECRKQGLFRGSVAITQPRPSDKARIDTINRQDGLYTLVIRGLENGERVECKETVSVFSKAIDPFQEWSEFLVLAESPDLQFVVSNVTEAGIAYRPEPLSEGQPLELYPGRLTAFLYHRFKAFQGTADKGLIMLPCELLERNGDDLKEIVLKHIADWGLPEAFVKWVEDHNRFLNTLVDRIVTGYPEDQASEWFAEWGYQDQLLNTAEPYHLWAIEGEPGLDEKLPLKQAGLNVRWVEDIRPYQLIKVRILNGAHTLMTPLGLLHGFEQVRDVMEHPEFGLFVRNAVEREIIPSIPLDADETKTYAQSVYERFLNPFIFHRLTDISMNSISKFKVRLLPTLEAYIERYGSLPDRLVRALAGLVRYYKVEKTEEGYAGIDLKGHGYLVRDDSNNLDIFREIWSDSRSRPLRDTVKLILSNEKLWGKDLSAVEGLTNAVSGHIEEMERERHA